MRDRQRSKVYKWEDRVVSCLDKNRLPFEQVEAVVRWIWKEEGLEYPPLVERLPKQKQKTGDAQRTCVRFRDTTYTWIVLHEIAHAMTSTVDYANNGHGALFMGIYIQLLTRYLKIPQQRLIETAEASGIKVTIDARPVFL